MKKKLYILGLIISSLSLRLHQSRVVEKFALRAKKLRFAQKRAARVKKIPRKRGTRGYHGITPGFLRKTRGLSRNFGLITSSFSLREKLEVIRPKSVITPSFSQKPGVIPLTFYYFQTRSLKFSAMMDFFQTYFHNPLFTLLLLPIKVRSI